MDLVSGSRLSSSTREKELLFDKDWLRRFGTFGMDQTRPKDQTISRGGSGGAVGFEVEGLPKERPRGLSPNHRDWMHHHYCHAY